MLIVVMKYLVGLLLIFFFLAGCTSQVQEPITLPVEEGSLVHDLPQVSLLEPDTFEQLIADGGVFVMQTHTP